MPKVDVKTKGKEVLRETTGAMEVEEAGPSGQVRSPFLPLFFPWFAR
jgi:hypothetical protein